MGEFKFVYPKTGDAYLTKLKSMAGLEIESLNKLEQSIEILSFVNHLFDHNGDNTPSSNDPITILKEARAGKSFRCVEYSLLSVGLLWAYGIPARIIGLKRKDVETQKYGAGHVVLEFWDAQQNKWVMCDVQFGVTAQFEGVFLSAYEIREKLYGNTEVKIEEIDNLKLSSSKKFRGGKKYIEWVWHYLYFIDTPTKISFENVDRKSQEIIMLIPVDAKPPQMFQGLFKMNAIYTHDEDAFYGMPKIK